MYFVYTIALFIVICHLYNFIKGIAPLYRRSFLDWPLVIFLSSQTLSTFFSVDVHTSIFGYYSRLNGGLLSLITYALLYWIIVVYIDEKFKEQIVNLFLTSGVLVAGFGIAQHFGIDKNVWVQDVQNRVFSTLGQPNWLAAYLCILLPFSVNKIFSSKKPVNYVFTIITFCLYLSLLYTKSKSGILAAVIAIGIYFFFKLFSASKKSILILISVFIIFSLTIENPIRDIVFPPPPAKTATPPTINITPSGDIRKIVWGGSIDLWKQFPIFGTGPETFAYTYYWTRPASHNLTSEWDFIYNKAHNEYLNYLATTGTFGFVAYILVIIFVMLNLFQHLHKKKINLVILSSFISILITNIAGFSVVIVSLFFFLLPVLSIQTNLSPSKPPGVILKSFSILLILISFFLLTKNLFFYLADITYAQADTFDSSDRYTSALEQIRLSVNYRPNEPVYLTKYANILSKLALTANNQKLESQAQNYTKQAVDAVNQATTISPFSLNLWKEKAQIYYYLSVIDTGYYLKALDALTKATLLAPTDAKSFYMLAEFYQNIKEYDASIKYYQQAIDLKPNYDHAYFALGKIYFDQKKYDLAKVNFEKTLDIAPANTDARNYLAAIATASAISH
jgi:putative inorganic carbon (hco3(-)) transporter